MILKSVLHSKLELVFPVKVDDLVCETGLLDLLFEVGQWRHEDVVIAERVSEVLLIRLVVSGTHSK